MVDAVDQTARDGVAKALAMIEAHERVCEERAKESNTWRNMLSDKLDNYFSGVDDRLADLTGQVSKIYGDMWAVTGAIIAILLAAIAYLIQNHGL
jgi:hypothetical protein